MKGLDGGARGPHETGLPRTERTKTCPSPAQGRCKESRTSPERRDIFPSHGSASFNPNSSTQSRSQAILHRTEMRETKSALHNFLAGIVTFISSRDFPAQKPQIDTQTTAAGKAWFLFQALFGLHLQEFPQQELINAKASRRDSLRDSGISHAVMQVYHPHEVLSRPGTSSTMTWMP